MADREKYIDIFEQIVKAKKKYYRNDEIHIRISYQCVVDILDLLKDQEDLRTELTNAVELIYKKNERIGKLLKEQEELIKHEYWRGYNNGRADERGLQEGTIMQTFSPD